MTVSVKVYFGGGEEREIRRFVFRPEDPKGRDGIYQNLVDRIRALFNGLNLNEIHLCWKDDDGDYVVFSSDDELRVAINSVTDNTLRIFIKERDIPRQTMCMTTPSTPRRTRLGNSHHRVSYYCGFGEPSTSSLATYNHRSVPDLSHETTGAPPIINNHVAAIVSHAEIVNNGADNDVDDPGEPLPYINTAGYQRVIGPRAISNRHSSLSAQNSEATNASQPIAIPIGSVTSMPAAGCSRNLSGGSVGSIGSQPLPSLGNEYNLSCSECHGEGRGVWYKCTMCSYYFICSDCEHRGLHDQHIMVRISAAAAAIGPRPVMPHGSVN